MSNRPLFQTTSSSFPKYQESELANWLRDMFGEGVLTQNGDEFALSVGSGSVTVGSGAGIVDGYFCPSRAPVTKGIGTPSATTRHRLVLRHDTANKTSSVELLAGVNGAPNPPDPSLVPGGVYELKLWQLIVTATGAITAIDERVWAYYRTRHKAKEYITGSIPPAALDRAYSTPLEVQRAQSITQFFMHRELLEDEPNGPRYVGLLESNFAPRYYYRAVIGNRVFGLNNAQNYWTVRLEFTGGSDQGTPWLFSTAAQTPGQWYRFEPMAHMPGFVYPISSGNNHYVQIVTHKTGNPGPIELIPDLQYRLVM